VILDKQVVGGGSSDASSSDVFALSGFTVSLNIYLHQMVLTFHNSLAKKIVSFINHQMKIYLGMSSRILRGKKYRKFLFETDYKCVTT